MSGAEFTRLPGGGGPPGNKAGKATAPPSTDKDSLTLRDRDTTAARTSTGAARRGFYLLTLAAAFSAQKEMRRSVLRQTPGDLAHRGGPSRFPAAYRRRWPPCLAQFTTGILVLVFLCSCGPRKVLTSLNAFEFHNERQKEECAVSTSVCDCQWEALQRWDKLLHEAGKAVKNGGKYPLQLKALKEAEAAYGACPK